MAKLANISVDEVKALNPEHYRPVMKVETINLPKDRVSQFKANLNNYQETEKPLSKWAAYTVQPGEKPASIADKFKMSLSQLQEANGVSLKSLSKPGQPLLVLTEGGELPKGAAPVSEMNENTPVSVPDEDKPSKSSGKVDKSGAKGKDSGKTAKGAKEAKNSKTNQSGAKAKAEKSSGSDKGSKSTKIPSAEKNTGNKSTATKGHDKASSGSSKATPAKSGGKADSKDKAKR